MNKVAILFMQYRQKNSNHTMHRFRKFIDGRAAI
jgi:hypothetical protein